MSNYPTSREAASAMIIPIRPTLAPEIAPSPSTAERLALPAPQPHQVGVFLDILRSDTAEQEPNERLVDTEVAYDVLLDRLSAAQKVRDRYNNPTEGMPDYVSELELYGAYAQGADALAGMIALTPSLVRDDTMLKLQEWSVLAASKARSIESSTRTTKYALSVTPETLAHDNELQEATAKSLRDLETQTRVFAYEEAASSGDIEAIKRAFTGEDASRLARAQALFEYAHTGISAEATDLKIACLEEVVSVLEHAVQNGSRPRDDDLVGVYSYFMLQSVLGRASHDVVWLDDQQAPDDIRVRRMSLRYLNNAADALDYVRYNAITAKEEPAKALRLAEEAFDATVQHDQATINARHTIDFLASGLNDLRDAEGALLDLKNNQYDWPEKAQLLADAEAKVATLSAKAEEEQLEAKIAEQQQIIADRLTTIRGNYQYITDRLMALRSEYIGSIRPGTYGNKLAKLVLDINHQLNLARHFVRVYSQEYDAARREQSTDTEVRPEVINLLGMLALISPDSENLQAPRLPKENAYPVAIAA